MYSAIARNKRNTVFIILFFLLIIGGLGALAAYVYNSATIAVVVIVGAALYALVQYFFAASQAVLMTGAVEISKNDDPRLWRTVENIAISQGLPMPKVYIVNDPAPNAFATGRDPQHAIVAATTGLLAMMDDSELEGVLAHEMGHVKNYDIRVSMIVFGLTVAIGFIADLFLRMAFFGGRNRDSNSNPVVLVFGLVAMIVAPIVAAIVQAAVSRQREYLADATGALITRHPEGLASALAKLGAYGAPMRRQNSSMAHLWIADPLKPSLMSRLFSTHPPIADRIARLNQIGGRF
ncbi:M48 family metalloprotease [Rathayibacter sp. YIM 133350]|uniref:M48 family metalloprotease n=1 Tax=Rathayibacter sp. YIM 133350 TaxID=3131992 RepID=UPI00307F4CDB